MTDNRTLDEVKQDDIGMLGDILKASKQHPFISEAKAIEFQSACLYGTLEKMGLKMNANMDPMMVDRILKTKGIKVEKRAYNGEMDKDRTGFYVYRVKENGDEMVAFISDPMLVTDPVVYFEIKTNVVI
jgi:hypothetical protein